MDFYAFSALINAVTSLLLGFFVFLKNKKNTTNVTFVLLTGAVFFWSLFYFFWQIASDYSSALLFTRILSIGSVFIPIFYLHWILSFLGVDSKESKAVLFFGYIITFVFCLFSFSPLFIKNVEKTLFFEYWPKAGIIYSAYLIVSYVGLTGYGISQLLKNYWKTVGLLHYQIEYILIGSFIGFAGGLTNFFLWYNIPIPPFGNIIVSLYVFILFYAMIRYRLMDMRIIVKQIFIYLVVSVFTYVFFYLLVLFYNYCFGGVFTMESYTFGVVIAPIFILILYNTSKVIQNFVNKHFFTSLYNYQETVSKVAEELTNYIDLTMVVKLIRRTIKDTMKISNIKIFLKNKENIYRSVECKKNKKPKIIENKKLVRYLAKNQKVLVGDELQYFYEEGRNDDAIILEIYCYMRDMGISICLPLTVNKKLIGMIMLGNKESESYTKEDLELLTVLSKQASVAIENARQYKQINDFGRKLQEKVDEQVKDIKEKNEHLQELLVMRSDFLKVISHQLNTPLSIIRGYLSMMKEGDYEIETALPMIETGLYRIIGTVNDFYEAYKLEGENPEMNFQKVNMEIMIKEVVKEKGELRDVKKKKLKIVIQNSKFEIPIVWCDLERIKRVIESLLDNAISYTEKGSITISYEIVDKKYLRVSIKDTGCGISEEDKERLFQKFSRGIRAPSIYQNGSGLGLYIAKKIIEGNGGEISYDSGGEGKGSTFNFTVLIYEGQKKKKNK